MSDKNSYYDFVGDGMRVFLDYISRQTNKNSEYTPHTLVRAFEFAFSALNDINDGETCIGFSQDNEQNLIYNPYAVVLKKRKNGIEVLSIRNLKVEQELPPDFIIYVFRIQIHLDKIKDDTVTSDQMADTLNSVIPGNIFYALGDRWKEARDDFYELMKQGKIYLPNDPKFTSSLLKIKRDTPWEDYPNFIRSFIGSSIAHKIRPEGNLIVISSPKNWPIEKVKVFDIFTEFFLGKGSDYFLNMLKKQSGL